MKNYNYFNLVSILLFLANNLHGAASSSSGVSTFHNMGATYSGNRIPPLQYLAARAVENDQFLEILPNGKISTKTAARLNEQANRLTFWPSLADAFFFANLRLVPTELYAVTKNYFPRLGSFSYSNGTLLEYINTSITLERRKTLFEEIDKKQNNLLLRGSALNNESYYAIRNGRETTLIHKDDADRYISFSCEYFSPDRDGLIAAGHIMNKMIIAERRENNWVKRETYSPAPVSAHAITHNSSHVIFGDTSGYMHIFIKDRDDLLILQLPNNQPVTTIEINISNTLALINDSIMLDLETFKFMTTTFDKNVYGFIKPPKSYYKNPLLKICGDGKIIFNSPSEDTSIDELMRNTLMFILIQKAQKNRIYTDDSQDKGVNLQKLVIKGTEYIPTKMDLAQHLSFEKSVHPELSHLVKKIICNDDSFFFPPRNFESKTNEDLAYFTYKACLQTFYSISLNLLKWDREKIVDYVRNVDFNECLNFIQQALLQKNEHNIITSFEPNPKPYTHGLAFRPKINLNESMLKAFALIRLLAAIHDNNENYLNRLQTVFDNIKQTDWHQGVADSFDKELNPYKIIRKKYKNLFHLSEAELKIKRKIAKIHSLNNQKLLQLLLTRTARTAKSGDSKHLTEENAIYIRQELMREDFPYTFEDIALCLIGRRCSTYFSGPGCCIRLFDNFTPNFTDPIQIQSWTGKKRDCFDPSPTSYNEHATRARDHHCIHVFVRDILTEKRRAMTPEQLANLSDKDIALLTNVVAHAPNANDPADQIFIEHERIRSADDSAHYAITPPTSSISIDRENNSSLQAFSSNTRSTSAFGAHIITTLFQKIGERIFTELFNKVISSCSKS